MMWKKIHVKKVLTYLGIFLSLIDSKKTICKKADLDLLIILIITMTTKKY